MNIRPARQTIGIIGAAIAGPTFALQILSHPILRKLYKPVIYNQRANVQSPDSERSLQTAGAALGLSTNGLCPLYQLGLKDAINEMSTELSEVRLWRASCSPPLKGGQGVRDAVPSGYRYLNYNRNSEWSKELQTNLKMIERRHLQSLLLDRVARLGGEVVWDKKLESVQDLESGATKLKFNDNTDAVVDLLVGRHILRARNEVTAQKRWVQAFMGATGFYGISSQADDFLESDGANAAATHGIWLDRGILSTSPLPNGKMRWDLIIPEKAPPEVATNPTSKS